MIRLEQVTKRYGKFTAVDRLTLHVPPGQLLGFLGPNGAGKTTTMKMIVGLLRPTAGRIRVDGVDLAADPIAVKRVIGYIPDRPYLYEKLTGEEFLVFVGDLFGVPRAERDRRIPDLLSAFALAGWEQELIESFSHGMKQRLVMAAAFLHRPKVIIVDEPMVGLDPRGARLVKRLFRRLCQERQVTVFLSTHTLAVAEEICQRIAILDRGRLVAEGDLDTLRERARIEGGDLEQVFLKLTEEDSRAIDAGDLEV